jgi:hypothetical protein
MKNKKGQDISVSTIILVVLGIAVLVFLVIGFNRGWSNFLPWLSGNNVDTIKSNCQTACASNARFNFCSEERILNDGSKTTLKTNCYKLSTEPANKKYGIEPCGQFGTCS